MTRPPDSESPFGRLLQEARARAGLSRDELARRVGLDASHVYRIETGGRRPSRESVLALAEALGLEDATVNEWLVAAGHAPMPVLTALRAAVRTRGAAPGPARKLAPASPWDSGVWARRLEAIGLREPTIQRLLQAMAGAGLAEQAEIAGAISSAFSRAAEALECTVRAAVIPAAGRHHRVLAPHAMQRLLVGAMREAAESGISRIILVLAPGAEGSLYRPLREALELAVVPRIRLEYIEQPAANGLGDAILCAAPLVEESPFCVLLPDDVVQERAGRIPERELRRMLAAFRELAGTHLIAVAPVPKSKMPHCGVARLGARPSLQKVFPVVELVEKPPSDHPVCRAPKGLGIVGRYLLQPGIFGELREMKKEVRQSLELTDALEQLRRQGSHVCGYRLEAERRDVGEAVDHAGELMGGLSP